MTDLRALLGDRYDDVMRSAALAVNLPRGGCDCDTCADDAAASVLAAVLPDLLAAAWDDGVAAMTQAVVLAREGRTAEARAAILPNPYRSPHDAAHTAAQGVPASQCGPDAARPADGIVRGTHYGTEGGER